MFGCEQPVQSGALAESEFVRGQLAETSLLQLDRRITAAGYQHGNKTAQIRFMSDEQNTLRFFVINLSDEIGRVAAGKERIRERHFLVEFTRNGLSGLCGANVRAG